MTDTVFVHGVDLSDYLEPISLLDGFVANPPLVGSDYRIPGRPGAIPANLGVDVRVVSVGGLLSGRTLSPPYLPADITEARTAYLTKLQEFNDVVFYGGQPFNLTWVSGSQTRSTLARYSGGTAVNPLAAWVARVAVEFTLLNPYWT